MSKEDYNKIVEQVEKISSNLTDEQKTLLGGTLSDIKFKAQSLSDDVGNLLQETMSRKEKLREYQEKESKWAQEKEQLSNDETLKKLQMENQELTKFKTEVFQSRKQEYANQVKNLKSHPNFEKVKDKLVIPEFKDDGVNFGDIDDNQVLQSYEKLNEYKDLGLFEKQSNPKPGTPKIPELPDDMSPAELAQKNPDAYKEYRKIKGY